MLLGASLIHARQQADMRQRIALEQQLDQLNARKMDLTIQIARLEMELRIDRHANRLARAQMKKLQTIQAHLKRRAAERQSLFPRR